MVILKDGDPPNHGAPGPNGQHVSGGHPNHPSGAHHPQHGGSQSRHFHAENDQQQHAPPPHHQHNLNPHQNMHLPSSYPYSSFQNALHQSSPHLLGSGPSSQSRQIPRQFQQNPRSQQSQHGGNFGSPPPPSSSSSHPSGPYDPSEEYRRALYESYFRQEPSESSHTGHAVGHQNFMPSSSSSSSQREEYEELLRQRNHSRQMMDFENEESREKEEEKKEEVVEEEFEEEESFPSEMYDHVSRKGGRAATFQDERAFARLLKESRGWEIVHMKEDGACLFRAVAFHVYGDQEFHGMVRAQCMDYMLKNRDHFEEFIVENYDDYVERKRNEREYGNHVEIHAMAELFNRNIEIYEYSNEPINTFRASGSAEEPIRVSYHGGIHYNAILDPAHPSFGVGLGFADLRPGEADKKLMEDALKTSEKLLLEQDLMTEGQHLSELEDAQRQLEETIMRESLQEYYRSHIEKH